MLGNTKGTQLTGYFPDYVLFDLETTGISCNYDEIIEISAVRVRGGVCVAEFSKLVNPRRPIPHAASAVNNITDAMVAGAPAFEKVLPEFLEFIGEDILVGHNIHSFDMKFLYRDCDRFFGKTLTNSYVDTLRVAKLCFPDWHHRRLGDLAEYYGISTDGAHRALADCRMNQQVYELMGKEPAMNGTADTEMKVCPECGCVMELRSGRFGTFWGCQGYPLCRHTERVKR